MTDELDAPITTLRGVSRPERLDARTQALLDSVLPALMERLRFGPELAAGGIGAVRVVFDRALQRRMAAKVLHDRSYAHYLLVRGFVREAQVTGQLDHPNIAPIYELGRDPDGGLFFTMKLLVGRTLHELVDGTPARDPERLHARLGVFLKVCDALAFAHSRGVLHCDIKPANVLVGDFGQVYLMDWGSAKLLPLPPGVDPQLWVREELPPLRPGELEGIIFGTLEYMSPEQAMGRHAALDERSDVFLLGALLYELLTGQSPYNEDSTRLLLRMAELGDIAPPERVVGGAVSFPPELVRITMRALARRPEERYPSVVALQDDLHALLRGGGGFAVRTAPAGTLVIREGEVGDAAYIVREGRLKVFKQTAGSARVTLRELGPGDVFGETAIFASTPRSASVIVIEDAELIVVTRAVIDQELGSMQPWLAAFVRTLAARFGAREEDLAGS